MDFARCWNGDTEAAAAIEFALLLPVVLLLYLGGFEISQAVATYRKLSDLTTELASVASQYTLYSKTTLDTINSASAQVMAPFSTSNLTISTTEFTTTAVVPGPVTIVGSRSLVAGAPGTPYNKGLLAQSSAPAAMKAATLRPLTTYLLVQSSYNYTLSVGANFIDPIPTMNTQILFLPRQVTPIPCTDCD